MEQVYDSRRPDVSSPISVNDDAASPDKLECSCQEASRPRWKALLLIACITLGNYYIFDLPGTIGMGAHSMQARFMQAGKQYSQTMNGVLYSVYSWPSLFVAVIGGFLIDRLLGLYKGATFFSMFVLLGSVVFSWGVFSTSYVGLVASRLLFGTGGEAQIVAQYMFVSRWFPDGRGVTVAYGIIASFQRAGIATTFYLAPRLASEYGVMTASNFGIFMSSVSILALFVALYYDRKMVKEEGLPEATIVQEGGSGGIWQTIKKDTKRGTFPLLLLGIYNALISMGLYGFCAIVINYFEVRFDLTGPAAGNAVTVFYLVIIFFSPFLGSIIDRSGYLVWWLAVAGALAAIVTYAFKMAFLGPYLFMGLLAVPQSIVLAALYPLVPLTAPPDTEALAFGLTVSMQNIGLAIGTALNGVVLDKYVTSINGEEAKRNCATVGDFRVGQFPHPHHHSPPLHHESNINHRSHHHLLHTGGHHAGSTHSISSHVSSTVTGDVDRGELPCVAGYFAVTDIIIFCYILAALFAIVIHFVDKKWYGGLLNTSPARRFALMELLNEPEDFSGTPTPSPEQQRSHITLLSPVEKAHFRHSRHDLTDFLSNRNSRGDLTKLQSPSGSTASLTKLMPPQSDSGVARYGATASTNPLEP